MPYLTPEDRKQYLGETTIACPKCRANQFRGYCRKCDEFFFECQCPGDHEHLGHRIYESGIKKEPSRANPDFDSGERPL